jgi:hypothetical protein
MQGRLQISVGICHTKVTKNLKMHNFCQHLTFTDKVNDNHMKTVDGDPDSSEDVMKPGVSHVISQYGSHHYHHLSQNSN